MVLSFLLTSAHFWRQNQKWRHVTSRRRIFSKLRQTVPFYDILLRSKFEVNLMFQTEIMAICVHSSSKHVFWHFLTFCRKMHEIWHINSHNFRSTHSIKLVDPSLELYLVVLSFKILTLVIGTFFDDVSTYWNFLWKMTSLISTCWGSTEPSHYDDDLKFLYDISNIQPQLVTKFQVIYFIQSRVTNHFVTTYFLKKNRIFRQEVPPTRPPVPYKDDPQIHWNFATVRLKDKN